MRISGEERASSDDKRSLSLNRYLPDRKSSEQFTQATQYAITPVVLIKHTWSSDATDRRPIDAKTEVIN
jgi:hypothetical protein